MSTPLTDRITGLTAQANAVTGASDTTLTDAAGRLIAGYGQNALVAVEHIGQYILPSSWENDKDGNPVAIYSVICNALGISDSDLSAIDAYVMTVIDNQNTGSYGANMLYKTKDTSSASYSIRNNKSLIRGWNTGVSLWISKGAVIEVHKITYTF